MQVEQLVIIILGVLSSAAIGVASYGLKSHLSLTREFDQFRGQTAATYVTPSAVKEAVGLALAPLVEKMEGLSRRLDHNSRITSEIARRMHIPAAVGDEG